MTGIEIEFLKEQTKAMHQLAETVMALPMDHSHTLTEAVDWPMLAMIGVLLISLLVYIWQDTKAIIKVNRVESRVEFKELQACIRAHRREWQGDLDKETKKLRDEIKETNAALQHCKDQCEERINKTE